MVQPPRQALGTSLRDLLFDAQFIGGHDIYVMSCCGDYRHVKPGDLYVALPGGGQDGHDHAQQAVARGARAVLAERLLPLTDVPMCLVEDSRDAYGRICHALSGDPSGELRVVGVAGDGGGQTITACMIACMLQASGADAGLMCNLGCWDGCEYLPAQEATPPATSLARWLARTAACGCTHAVMEVSTRAIREMRIAGIQFDTWCLGHVQGSEAAEDGHGPGKRATLPGLLGELEPGGMAALSADDPNCDALAAHLTGPAVTYGTTCEAEVTGTVIERHEGEQTFLLSIGSDIVPVRTRVCGEQHVRNCLAAAAVGFVYGVDLPTIARGLETVDQQPGPMQPMTRGLWHANLSV